MMRIGIDVGGTKARAVVLSASGAVLARTEMPSGRGAVQVLATVRSIIARLVPEAGQGIESVGIGIPGTIDLERGIVSNAVNLGLDVLHLREGLADLPTGPVKIDNDVNAAALGAHRLIGAGVDSLAYLNVGTGIAAGLILNGVQWHGFRGVSGEVGHLPGRGLFECPCGQVGCLETVASGAAIARRAATAEHPFPSLTGAVTGGNSRAIAILDEVATGVADAAQNLFLVVGVDLVVLGGGVVDATPQLAPLVTRILDERAAASPFLISLELTNRLIIAPADLEIAAVGAALL